VEVHKHYKASGISAEASSFAARAEFRNVMQHTTDLGNKDERRLAAGQKLWQANFQTVKVPR
jgi:hypothetical protein